MLKALLILLLVLNLMSFGCSEPSDDSHNSDPNTPSTEYALSACYIIGGIDRIFIEAERQDEPGCIRMHLIVPDIGLSPFDIQTPYNWDLPVIRASHQACAEMPHQTGTNATDGSGKIDFSLDEDRFPPDSIAVDIQLSFPTGSTLGTNILLVDDDVKSGPCT